MVIDMPPPFPRWLSPAKRGAEFKRVAAMLANQAIAENPKLLDRVRLIEGFSDAVNTSWTSDRIFDLERRLDALDAAAQPALAKRAKLKQKGGADD